MKRLIAPKTILMTAALGGLLSLAMAQAKKPDNPGGGGGDTSALFTLTDLGGFTDGNGVQSEALNLNNPNSDGGMQVAGYISPHAAIWGVDASGTVTKVTDIHPPSYSQSVSRQINDFGQAVVGNYLWIPGHGLTTLPGFGDGFGEPAFLNNVGGILGTATDSIGNVSFAMWQADAQGNIAGPYAIDFGDSNFIPRAMNDLEVMAGYVETGGEVVSPNAAIAYVDEFGVMQVMELGALAGDTSSEATAINNYCEVVGESFEPVVESDGHTYLISHAFLWTPSNGFRALGDLGGGTSRAYDINDSLQIVGEARSNYGKHRQRAFLWQDGVMLDLNAVTETGASNKAHPHLYGANAINNAGYIAGALRIDDPGREDHGFLLVPKNSSP